MKKKERVYVPYANNKDIFVEYELPFKKDIIKPGDKIMFRGIRGLFVFERVATNTVKNVTWIDCRSDISFEYRSFYVDRLKGVQRPKKRRRKRVVQS